MPLKILIQGLARLDNVIINYFLTKKIAVLMSNFALQFLIHHLAPEIISR